DLGSTPLGNLTREQIEAWITGLGFAPSSQRRYLAPLKAALNEAVDRGQIGFSPAEKVKLAPVDKKRKDAYSSADRSAILAAATGYNAARWHFGLLFGPRPGEALGLTWPDIDFGLGTVTIRRELLYAKGTGTYLQDASKSEAGTDRVIYLPDYLVAMFRDQRSLQLKMMAEMGDEWEGWEYLGQPVPLVFTQSNGRPIGARMDTERWHTLTTAAGLADARRYKARHTAATHLITDTGGNASVTADILGHADGAFTYRVYVHPLEEVKRQLAKQMNAPYGAPYAADTEQNQAELEHENR
ncbi:MAG: integrase, partial [Subtercola sp.]|nr:integrase [Subtercola sp.]